MRRHVFNFFAVVSLLFFAATCLLWVRGYSTGDDFYVLHGKTRDFAGDGSQIASAALMFRHANGLLRLRHIPWLGVQMVPTGQRWGHTTLPAAKMPPGLDRRLGFGPHRRTLGPVKLEWNQSEWLVYVPDFVMATVCLLLPMCWVWLAIRRRVKRQEGLCVVCGYDLRASPDRCPECGRSVNEKAA